jgi:hypothetical protein
MDSLTGRLQRFERGPSSKIKRQLFRRHHMHDDDIVAAGPDDPQRSRKLAEVPKTIRQQDEKPASTLTCRAVLDLRAQTTRSTGIGGIQRRKDRSQVCGMLLGRNKYRSAFMKDRDAHRISLMQQQSGQTSSCPSGKIQFARRRQSESHRAARVDRKHCVHVRFFLKLSDEVAVIAGVNLPVDLAYLVTRCVLAMLCKFATTSFRG